MEERLLALIEVDPSGCWQFLGHKNTAGYGKVKDASGRTVYAHRLAYETWVGPIPPGWQVDHVCRKRACCNPSREHLEAVTPRVNTLRSNGVAAIHARQVACIHGHVFDELNTYRTPDGRRDCRTCRRERKRLYRTRAAA